MYIDVRNWFSNIEQHASEGVNKILIGNKCDMEDKRVIYIYSVLVEEHVFLMPSYYNIGYHKGTR